MGQSNGKPVVFTDQGACGDIAVAAAVAARIAFAATYGCRAATLVSAKGTK